MQQRRTLYNMMRSSEFPLIIRRARNAGLIWLLVNAIGPDRMTPPTLDASSAPVPATTFLPETPWNNEEEECPPGQHIVYMRPPHPGSTTRAVSREPSTAWSRLSALERRIAHPDPRASTTLHDFVDVFMPDQEACK